MGTSTSRLIILAVIINLVIGVCLQYYSDQSYDISKIENEVASLNQLGQQMEESDLTSGQTSQDLVLENTPGNVIEWGLYLWEIFKKAFVPFPMGVGEANTNLERIAIYGLFLFRGLLYFVVGLQVVKFFKNKDNS